MAKGVDRHGHVLWTAASLREWFQSHEDGRQVIVVANRQPYSHEIEPGGRIVARRSSSGLVRAVEPLIQATSGVWIAHGSGSADRLVVDGRDGLTVSPDAPPYRLRRVWLEPDEVRGYYDGFANEALWPLCHRAHVRPVFRSDDFNTYWSINSRFVDAVCDEAQSPSPLVLVQDYHLALAPRMIAERLPLSTIVAFWHIPWPTWQNFEVCPWGQHLLEGLLGAHVLGFQTPTDSRNFVETVEHSLEAHVSRDRHAVTYEGRRTLLGSFPTSIEWPGRWVEETPPADACREAVRQRLQLDPDMHLGLGVARFDYTKGIEEAFCAVERLFECYPEYRNRFVFVQLAEPSRLAVPAYAELRARVAAVVDRVNQRFGRDRYQPAILLDAHHDGAEVCRFMRAADVCYVGSLHDGMNLVAKEFVAARNDGGGTLLLSAFAGAAGELADALVVNPYDVDEVAHTLARALSLGPPERQRHMQRMRAVVAEGSAYRWAGQILMEASRARAREEVRAWTPSRRTLEVNA